MVHVVNYGDVLCNRCILIMKTDKEESDFNTFLYRDIMHRRNPYTMLLGDDYSLNL